MNKLPPLTEVIDNNERTAEGEFKQLIDKLIIRQSLSCSFKFVQEENYRNLGIDGIVMENYFENIICPVIFHYKWLTSSLRNAEQQIKLMLERVSKSKVSFRSFILITPMDSTPEEKVWLGDFSKQYNIDVYHYGHTIIHELLNDHPPLKKYYYGKYIEESFHNFNDINKKYLEYAIKEIKNIDFIGLPTGQYQQQDLIKKPELQKIYIPIEFGKEKNSSERLTLSEITKNSKRFVILGDPGTGKSTLAKYISLMKCTSSDNDDSMDAEVKTPFIIPVRDFVRVWNSKAGLLNFIDYLKFIAENSYGIGEVDEDFFKAVLELGKAIVIFDGLDEIISEVGKRRITRDIIRFCTTYPETEIWITSRIVGFYSDLSFESEKFSHYYIQPVSNQQVELFIEKWYEIQISQNNEFKVNRINSLKNAVNDNPGVQRLKVNPLLLTMMTLVHQFEGTLPDDRARLYDKCIELLLKTWQDQKYSITEKNPLEERGLNYNEQMRLLAAAAFYIQNKMHDKNDEDIRGLIEEQELFEVLFKARFDRKRMSVASAKEDIKIFLDYIISRSGLLVERGKSKNNGNVFAFVHLSFLEYLCAYQMAEDKSKAQWEHIQQLIKYLGKPSWEEVILLSLYIFSKSTGSTSFSDRFASWAFENLDEDIKLDGLFLLGRAVRDNINFAAEDVKKIIKMILKIWQDKNEFSDHAFSVLKEIADFSRNGKITLKVLIKNVIKQMKAKIAFDFLYLYNHFFKIDLEILNDIENNTDKLNLFPYLPIFKNNVYISKYLNLNLHESDWFIFYNSVKERAVENIERIMKDELNDFELKGCILSSWLQIYETFRERYYFLASIKTQSRENRFRNIKFDFKYATISFPLNLFQNFMLSSREIIVPRITDINFIALDKQTQISSVNEKYFSDWICKILINALSGHCKSCQIEKDTEKKIQIISQKFSYHLNKIFNQKINTFFCKTFFNRFSAQYQLYLTDEFSFDFSQYLVKNFDHDFRGYLDWDFSLEMNQNLINNLFSNYFQYDFNLEFCAIFFKTLSQSYGNELKKNDLQFMEFITKLYLKKYQEELDWTNLSDNNIENIYKLFIDEFSKENNDIIVKFYWYLHYYLHSNFEISFEHFESMNLSISGNSESDSSNYTLSIRNALMFPFIFDFILIGAFNHYTINLLADLNHRLPKGQIPSTSVNSLILSVIENFYGKNPFISYLINLSWNFYSKEFNDNINLSDESSVLRVSAFLIHAAKISLMTGINCEGNEWDRIMSKAENSDNLFVQISLTLYNLSIFKETKKNEILLEALFKKLESEFPEIYQLIGFNS